MKSNDCIDIQIKESNLELLSMIQKENDPILRKRLLALQIFVSGVAKSYLSIARTLGISPNSVSTWFRLYEKAGIKAVLSRRKTGPVVGSSTVLKPSTIETVMKRLADPEVGFQSFVELQNFISELEGTEVKYYTIYRFFRKGKGAKLKVVRPSNVKKNENLALVIKKKLDY